MEYFDGWVIKGNTGKCVFIKGSIKLWIQLFIFYNFIVCSWVLAL